MAHAYSHLFRLPTTGLHFFTVYGPWSRPDMALFFLTRNFIEGKPIKVFNHGDHTRDFICVDDVVVGIIRASDQIATPNADRRSDDPDHATSNAPFRIYNIGNNTPVKHGEYIEAIEGALGKRAIRALLPLQPGDVPDTYADVTALKAAVDYGPATPVKEGVRRYVERYREYHGA